MSDEAFARENHDACSLPVLTETTLMSYLNARYDASLLTCGVSNILVSLTPSGPTPPTPENPFSFGSVADDALRSVTFSTENVKPACIVVSGESGAGKTEATKRLVSHLASYSVRTSRASVAPTRSDHAIEAALEAASPITEVFGNAATSRNLNSSRFGKFIRIHVDRTGVISGGSMEHYLLEHSRIVRPPPGERNFHIFYALLAAPPDVRPPALLPAATYAAHGVIPEPDTPSPIAEADVRASLQTLGLPSADIATVYDTVALVANTACLDIDGEPATVAPGPALSAVAAALGVSPASLSAALTTRPIASAARDSAYARPLTVAEARSARDSLAVALYSRLFDQLIGAINRSLTPGQAAASSPHHSYIGILDIFGFESFAENSLEQLLINYANERLQQLFVETVLRAEQQVYQEEGVSWDAVEYRDGKPLLDLFGSKRPPGLLALLEEECISPGGSDTRFLTKCEAMLAAKSADFAEFSANRGVLTVRHYGGTVRYTASNFVAKNSAALPTHLLTMLQRGPPHIAALFADASKEAATRPRRGTDLAIGTVRGNRAGRTRLVTSSFTASLASLTNTLAASNLSFIRCVRPHRHPTTAFFDATCVLGQLRALGLLEATKVRQAGFSHRFPLSDFLTSFAVLETETTEMKGKRERERVQELLAKVGVGGDGAVCGRSRVLLRLDAFAILARRKEEADEKERERKRAEAERLERERKEREEQERREVEEQERREVEEQERREVEEQERREKKEQERVAAEERKARDAERARTKQASVPSAAQAQTTSASSSTTQDFLEILNAAEAQSAARRSELQSSSPFHQLLGDLTVSEEVYCRELALCLSASRQFAAQVQPELQRLLSVHRRVLDAARTGSRQPAAAQGKALARLLDMLVADSLPLHAAFFTAFLTLSPPQPSQTLRGRPVADLLQAPIIRMGAYSLFFTEIRQVCQGATIVQGAVGRAATALSSIVAEMEGLGREREGLAQATAADSGQAGGRGGVRESAWLSGLSQSSARFADSVVRLQPQLASPSPVRGREHVRRKGSSPSKGGGVELVWEEASDAESDEGIPLPTTGARDDERQRQEARQRQAAEEARQAEVRREEAREAEMRREEAREAEMRREEAREAEMRREEAQQQEATAARLRQAEADRQQQRAAADRGRGVGRGRGGPYGGAVVRPLPNVGGMGTVGMQAAGRGSVFVRGRNGGKGNTGGRAVGGGATVAAAGAPPRSPRRAAAPTPAIDAQHAARGLAVDAILAEVDARVARPPPASAAHVAPPPATGTMSGLDEQKCRAIRRLLLLRAKEIDTFLARAEDAAISVEHSQHVLANRETFRLVAAVRKALSDLPDGEGFQQEVALLDGLGEKERLVVTTVLRTAWTQRRKLVAVSRHLGSESTVPNRADLLRLAPILKGAAELVKKESTVS